MRIYVFGNEYLEQDNMAVRIARELRYNFVYCQDPFQALESIDPVILDVIQGIGEVTILEDISQLKHQNMYSLHDFDLGFLIQLYHQMGKLAKITIIGVPDKGNFEQIKQQVQKAIESLQTRTD